MTECQVCKGKVTEFLDLGRQPLSDAFLPAPDTEEFFFRLAVGRCEACTMIQLMETVPPERMFHADYPYYSSGSSVMRDHFARTARDLIKTRLVQDDPFVVEIGCNDGIMLKTVQEAGIRHLGFEPSSGVAKVAQDKGVQVRTDFFGEDTAAEVAAAQGSADVIFSANTFCHIPYVDSIFWGIDALLARDGVFVFEDPYWGDIVGKTSFDQIYDEHFFFFTATSVRAMARRFGFELVDVERLPVHGGEVRYTLARAGRHEPAPAVAALIKEEAAADLTEVTTLRRFATNVGQIRQDLVALLTDLKAKGHTVAGYGATAKSATVTNFCGIGPDLVDYVCDTTPAKQHRLSPGTHIPIKPPEVFAGKYPDYALLFAWNHAAEIMAKEKDFRSAGGQWIRYVPDVHVV